jgi:hypothetical protein
MTPETILEHEGIQQPIIEWALDYGITPAIIIGRLERGISIADAINTPMKTGHQRQRLPVFSKEQVNRRSRNTVTPTHTVNGITKTIAEWAEGLNLSVSSLQQRLAQGMPLEVALTTPNMTQKKQSNRLTCSDADRQAANTPPGVPDNFPACLGTGAGRSVQKNPEIIFHKEAAE